MRAAFLSAAELAFYSFLKAFFFWAVNPFVGGVFACRCAYYVYNGAAWEIPALYASIAVFFTVLDVAIQIGIRLKNAIAALPFFEPYHAAYEKDKQAIDTFQATQFRWLGFVFAAAYILAALFLVNLAYEELLRYFEEVADIGAHWVLHKKLRPFKPLVGLAVLWPGMYALASVFVGHMLVRLYVLMVICPASLKAKFIHLCKVCAEKAPEYMVKGAVYGLFATESGITPFHSFTFHQKYYEMRGHTVFESSSLWFRYTTMLHCYVDRGEIDLNLLKDPQTGKVTQACLSKHGLTTYKETLKDMAFVEKCMLFGDDYLKQQTSELIDHGGAHSMSWAARGLGFRKK